MIRALTWAGLAVVVLLGIGFATANAGREVSVELGLFTLHGVPVTFVAFGGMVAGMAVVFVAGIHADLRVRRLLRERHLEPERRPRTAEAAPAAAPVSDREPPMANAPLDAPGDSPVLGPAFRPAARRTVNPAPAPAQAPKGDKLLE